MSEGTAAGVGCAWLLAGLALLGAAAAVVAFGGTAARTGVLTMGTFAGAAILIGGAFEGVARLWRRWRAR